MMGHSLESMSNQAVHHCDHQQGHHKREKGINLEGKTFHTEKGSIENAGMGHIKAYVMIVAQKSSGE